MTKSKHCHVDSVTCTLLLLSCHKITPSVYCTRQPLCIHTQSAAEQHVMLDVDVRPQLQQSEHLSTFWKDTTKVEFTFLLTTYLIT